MPPGRTKEDTWKADDLEKSLKGARGDTKHKDKKDRHRDGDTDDRKHRRKKQDDEGEVKDKKRSDRDRDKNRDRDKDRDKHRSSKEGGDKPRDRDKDRHRDDKEHRRKREDDGDDKERRHRKHKDEGDDKEKRHRKHRDEDDGHRKKDDRKKHRDDDRDKKKHRDDDDRERRHRRHKEEDGEEERKHRSHKDKEDDDDRRKRREERHKEKEREKEREREEEKKSSRASGSHSTHNGKADEEDDYEDDFEDYEDDFEDGDKEASSSDSDDSVEPVAKSRSQPTTKSKPSQERNKSPEEMNEIMRAMNDENERLLSASKQRDTWSDSPDSDEQLEHDRGNRPTTGGARTFINFVSAKQRQISNKASSKARRRGKELLQIIEMDRSSFDMFDMPPIGEYELYMRSFGSSNTKQAIVQTNDDNIDRDIQTEDIESSEKWSQHPPEDFRVSGGPDEDNKDPDADTKPVDSVRLNKFIEMAGKVMLVLMEEKEAELARGDASRKPSSICVSEAYSELVIPAFLKGRAITHSHFSPVQSHLMLTAHSTPVKQSSQHGFSSKGFVCVWSVNEPSWPQKVLVCESQPRCCCFSPTKATLAFAGMSDGSLTAWDLRESATLHQRHVEGDREFILRHPTYDTAGVLQDDNHHSAVVSLTPIIAPGEGTLASVSGDSNTEEGAGLSFQLASLEENSVVHLWVVAEIANPDPVGSESDLGLAPGGRIKLLKSASIQLENPLKDARLRTTMQAFDMQLLPSNNSHFYVATDVGCIIHGVRYGGKAPPKAYTSEDDNPVKVTSIDFSPFSEPVFLAGCSDGSLRLYHIDSECPLMVWPVASEGHPIQLVRWCRSRPSVFFVIDEQSHLYIWALSMDDAVSLKQQKIAESRVTSIALSNDHSATGLGVPGRRPQMVVCLEDGTAELHTISQEFSALVMEEVDQFAALLQQIT